MKNLPPTLGFRRPRFKNGLRAGLRVVSVLGIALSAALFGAPSLRSQTSTEAAEKPATKSATSKIAAIKSFRIVQEKDGQAVEILSTKPLVPSIRVIDDPARLVIDLPNSRLDTQEKRISVQADQISAIRGNQFQENPPVTRIVVDLQAPRAFTWDAAGNRLVVHLGKSPATSSSPFQAPTVTSLTSSPQPVVTSVRAAGPLSLAGHDESNGSTITAAADTAVVRLSSGGEVHVCPGTTVSVTPSQNRHNLMLSMNTGAMEAHFALDASSDSVLTPDFRIVLVGPGEFHYAISADSQGNTCVRALPGNTASAMVSELLGDRTYQVKATDQLVFRAGQLDKVDMAVPIECGCPPQHDSPMRASELPTQSEARGAAAGSKVIPSSAAPAQETARPESAAPAASVPLEASIAPNDLHVQITAPFVFHATGPPPAPLENVRALPPESRTRTVPELAAPLPPPANGAPKPSVAEPAAANRPASRGFFKRLGGFFASLFH